ncbi:MAG: family 16 glycosylhydrolase [Porticoccaceae bacterium]|nr:family 16 glycosylhydrolase [Porticoccaceae bacterium]MDG1473685.1 family 16 glycosylhydrolase [Porticoccaceae bacterium]
MKYISFKILIVTLGLLILSSTAASQTSDDWDIDNDGRADALTDGLLFLRYSFGLTGESLINGVVAEGAEFTTAPDLEAQLAAVSARSGDIDLDGEVNALTDGLLLIRYLFGLDGETLTENVLGENAVRTASADLASYISSLLPKAPYITLIGGATVDHEQATPYIDSGASANDYTDGPLDVTVTGSVDEETAGIYTLVYSAVDTEGNQASSVSRQVTVADTTAPVITLLGESALEIDQNTSYQDAGATAQDRVDGEVPVEITGIVDSTVSDTYTVAYSATDAAGNTATLTRTVTVRANKVVLNVFTNGEVDGSWEAGIQAADSGIGWQSCENDGGDACPNIAWEIVQDQERGDVLQIEHSSAGQQAILYFKTNSAQNLTLYAGGQVKFDIKTISGSSNYTMKIDCIYDCTSGDRQLGTVGNNGWESVSIEIDDLVNQGLSLTTIDTGLVIWASQYTNTIFQIDNVRWEDTDGGEPPEEPMADDGWEIPSFSGYTSPQSYDGYSLVWSDEFSGTEINTDNWSLEVGGGGWGNNELQYYTNRNAYLKDGMLVIRAEQESFGGRNYTSARMKTQGKQNFKYGRVDIRARMPEGQGMWPALWMLGKNIDEVSWPSCGEIDIMEMVGGGNGRDNRVHGTAHWNNGGLQQNIGYNPVSYGGNKLLSGSETLATNFHVFSIIWDDDSITWYIDDVQYHVMAIDSSASLAAFQKEFFLIFNIAVGGDWPQSPDASTVFPQRMVVDYVRIFQESTAKPVNSSKWFHQTQLPNGNSWYNGEQQHYTNRIENTSVENGVLTIKAKKERYEDQGVTKEYTSARLNSKFAFTYGRIEVKAKIPEGQGTWPAIWMLSKDIDEPGGYFAQEFGTTAWPDGGEIDILEHWGNNPNYAQSAIHTRSSFGGTVNHGGQSVATMTSDFHVYSLDWSADKMIFAVDDIEHYTYQPEIKNDQTWPFDNDQYLLLNFAIESSIDPDFTEGNLEIDFVRVYDQSNTLIWSDEFD